MGEMGEGGQIRMFHILICVMVTRVHSPSCTVKLVHFIVCTLIFKKLKNEIGS